ncbi:MAG: hypothetical protein WCT01_04765 [Candidatus Shapirobacteria bacterium]
MTFAEQEQFDRQLIEFFAPKKCPLREVADRWVYSASRYVEGSHIDLACIPQDRRSSECETCVLFDPTKQSFQFESTIPVGVRIIATPAPSGAFAITNDLLNI